MKDYQFYVLMSGIFVVGSYLPEARNLYWVAGIWLLLAVVSVFTNRSKKAN